MKTYRKYALCIIKENRLLVQEEAGEEYYLLPGGRAEAEEGAIQALCREVREELGVELDIATINFLGKFEDIAAGSPDDRVQVELYQGDFHGKLTPCSEVKRLIWFDKNDDRERLSPIVRNKVLPALLEKGLMT
jgi:8-oxo-dGTP pyrophosphatase MutT (NUDIX family)